MATRTELFIIFSVYLAVVTFLLSAINTSGINVGQVDTSNPEITQSWISRVLDWAGFDTVVQVLGNWTFVKNILAIPWYINFILITIPFIIWVYLGITLIIPSYAGS